MLLEWIPEENKIVWQNNTIELLSKEYALLRFMFRHAGMVFSREQLLDRVWPMEYPTERTVDDHIYRLRKKLRPVSVLQLRTVRGYGYSLTVRKAALPGTTPTLADEQFQKLMQEAMGMYHRYGQGTSMLALAEQQERLGIRLDPFYAVYIRFVMGDWKWLLQTEEAPISERLYYLLLIYAMIGNCKRALDFCQSALLARVLPPLQHMEMEILNILDLFVLNGRADEALSRLELTWKTLVDPEMEEFVPTCRISELFVMLAADKPLSMLGKQVEAIEELLLKAPYLREIGGFQVMKGLLSVHSGKWGKGEALLDEGLEVLEASGFIPLKLAAVNRIVWFLEKMMVQQEPGPRLLRKYSELLQEEKDRLGPGDLAAQTDEMLAACLGRQ